MLQLLFEDNEPPSVSLAVSPPGPLLTPPGRFTLTATVAAGEPGSLIRVDFFNGSTSLGSATAAPYSLVWSQVPAGSYHRGIEGSLDGLNPKLFARP